MRPLHLVTTLLLSTACSAWPAGSDSPANNVEQEAAALVQRQGTSFDLSYSGQEGNTATTISSSKATGTRGQSNSDATITGTGTQSGGSQKSGSAKTTSMKTFNEELPPGGVSMVTPAATVTSYYKILNNVTFAWNFTSLSVTPSAIDILASCSANQETYTIALNQSVSKGSTQAVTWQVGAYQATATVPLLTQTYTLIIHDAGQPISAAPMAGYLGTYDQFTFGMYLPQPYENLNQWVCATCSAAITSAERQTLWFLLGTAGITVLSFSWFAGVAGLW